MTDPDVIEDLDRAMASMPGEFAYKTMKAAAIEIAALRDEITRLRASPWVSVEERKPEVSERLGNDELLLVVHNGEPEFAFYDKPDSWDCPDKGWLTPEKVTHWMPIPPLDPTPEQV